MIEVKIIAQGLPFKRAIGGHYYYVVLHWKGHMRQSRVRTSFGVRERMEFISVSLIIASPGPVPTGTRQELGIFWIMSEWFSNYPLLAVWSWVRPVVCASSAVRQRQYISYRATKKLKRSGQCKVPSTEAGTCYAFPWCLFPNLYCPYCLRIPDKLGSEFPGEVSILKTVF